MTLLSFGILCSVKHMHTVLVGSTEELPMIDKQTSILTCADESRTIKPDWFIKSKQDVFDF